MHWRSGLLRVGGGVLRGEAGTPLVFPFRECDEGNLPLSYIEPVIAATIACYSLLACLPSAQWSQLQCTYVFTSHSLGLTKIKIPNACPMCIFFHQWDFQVKTPGNVTKGSGDIVFDGNMILNKLDHRVWRWSGWKSSQWDGRTPRGTVRCRLIPLHCRHCCLLRLI